MLKKKASDFRYNTGETKVPWAAVGENYNAEDVVEVVRFLMQGSGEKYDSALRKVEQGILALGQVSDPPSKLSVDRKVTEAEELCDEYLNTSGSTFVTNCTAGFEIAGKYANLKPDDEVIVPAITFVATMAYPLSVGCKLVFADVDPKTLNIDPEDVARKITDKTKMIIPVHMGGYPVDMDPIIKLAKERDVLVLEDAAHGFGGEYKGKKLGTIGDFGSFSFHEVKNITSFGEGGIVCTNVASFRDDMRRARFLGADFSKKIDRWLYDVSACQGKYGPFVAGNASTTEIQALGLILQMNRIDQIIAKRRAAAEYLNKRLSICDALTVQDLGDDQIKPTFHLYQLQIDPQKAGGKDIQVLKQKLAEKGVTEIAHFGPLYRFSILKTFGYDENEIAKSCPNCEEVFYHRYTHFPLYGLSKEQLDYMADAILDSIDEMKKG